MHFSIAALTLAGSAVALSASQPFKMLPLGNGFPEPNAKAIAKIEENAGGPLPNGALPTKLSKTATATLQLLANQEIFEVAYFSSLLKNVTNDVAGYKSSDKKYLMRSLRRIRAQEELHALGLNAILKSGGQKPVGGCDYVFPVKTLEDALVLANVFTDVVLGVLPEVQAFAATDPNLAPLIPLLGSIQAQEGEQTGYFRSFQGKPPSAAPFLTGAAGQFAYSALKMFIKPGTCSVLPDVPSFPPIVVNTVAQPKDMTLSMTVEGKVDPKKMSVTYISGQHTPFTVPISDVQTKKGMSTFKASFPFSKGFAKGLTIAAVTKGKAMYSSPLEVADATAYGPGLIEVQ